MDKKTILLFGIVFATLFSARAFAVPTELTKLTDHWQNNISVYYGARGFRVNFTSAVSIGNSSDICSVKWLTRSGYSNCGSNVYALLKLNEGVLGNLSNGNITGGVWHEWNFSCSLLNTVGNMVSLSVIDAMGGDPNCNIGLEYETYPLSDYDEVQATNGIWGGEDINKDFAFELYEYVPIIPNLTDCGSLNQSGKTYYLDSDVTNPSGNCFEISADNVILDCQNHLIENVVGNGITGSSVSNITVKNCRVDNASQYGINFENSNLVTIDNNSVTNMYGVDYGDDGIRVYLSNNTAITNNFVKNNTWACIAVFGDAYANYVYDLNVSNNVMINCGWNEVSDTIDFVWNNNFMNSTDSNCFSAPDCETFRVYDSYNGDAENNFMEDQSDFGVWIDEWSNATIKNNTRIGDGSLDGQVLWGFDNVTGDVTNNTLVSSGLGLTGYGVYVYDSERGLLTFRNNTISGNFSPDNSPFYLQLAVPAWINFDVDTSNMVNGKSVYYFNGTSNISGLDAGAFYCIYCNGTISDIDASNSEFDLAFSSVNVSNVKASNNRYFHTVANISNSDFENGDYGLYVRDSVVAVWNSVIKNHVYDIFLRTSGFNASLYNVSMNDNYTYWYYVPDAYLSRYWYLTFSISGGYNPFNPHVIIKDSKNNTLFEGDTRTIDLTALEYIGSCASSCENADELRDYYTNYTINVSSSSYNKPFAGIFNFSESHGFSLNLESKVTSSGDLLTDVGSGIGAFLSAITLGVTQIVVYIAIIMGVLTIVYAIAYLVSNAMHKK